MDPHTVRRTLVRYYVYRALSALSLWAPIWVIYLEESRGLSLTEITVMDAAFWGIMAVAEVPTGMLADTAGRKASIMVGLFLQGCGLLVFGLVSTFPLLLLANMLWGVALTFVSGADQAFLFDTLQEAGREGDYVRVAGRGGAISHGAMAAGGVVGGLIGAYNLALPSILTGAMSLVTLAVVWTLREPVAHNGSPERRYRDTLVQSWQLARREPSLRYALVYGALIPIPMIVLTFIFIQPHARELGVPIAAMGLLLLGVRGAGMAGSTGAGWVTGRIGERAVLWAVPVCLAISMLLLGVIDSVLSLVLFGVVSLVSAIARLAVDDAVLRQVPASIRATTMSGQSLLLTLIFAIVEPALGYLGDRYGLQTSYAVLAVFVCIPLAPMLLWHRSMKRLLSAT